METMLQPKIIGYRQLTVEEVALMNEGKALAEQVGAFVEKLRQHPDTGRGNVPCVYHIRQHDGTLQQTPSLDQRWVSIGATHLQEGFMALTRAVAQQTTF